jgi:hypothetical protein
VWLLYGIQPKGARRSLTPGRCKGKAHKPEHLGIAGRRVLVSRKWSNKTLDVPLCSYIYPNSPVTGIRSSVARRRCKRRWWPVSPIALLPAEVADRSDENHPAWPSAIVDHRTGSAS